MRIKMFESFKKEEDIFYILLNISDLPELINNKEGYIIYKIYSNELDQDEIESAKGRLGDIGYSLLRISKCRIHNDVYFISILSNENLKKVNNNNIKLWDSIRWKKWELSKVIPGSDKTMRGQINLGVKWEEDFISIIDGKKLDANEIEVYVSWLEDEFRFSNESEAELFIIKNQLSYFEIK